MGIIVTTVTYAEGLDLCRGSVGRGAFYVEPGENGELWGERRHGRNAVCIAMW